MPTVKTISGEGKPRILLVMKSGDEFYDSKGTTVYTATTVTESDGLDSTNTTSSVADPTTITTSAAHGVVQDDWCDISGHMGSTPSIDGEHRVIDAPTSTTFRIDVNVTVGGTGGLVHRIPAFQNQGVRINQRVLASEVIAGQPNKGTYGKIKALDESASPRKLTVDKWVPSTPTGGQSFTVDGWITDLPRCQQLTEVFTPDVLVHNLFRGTTGTPRRETKFYGWRYAAILDYSDFISADTLIDMRQELGMRKDDKLILIPREDVPGFQYNVYYAEPIEIALDSANTPFPHYEKAAFVFSSTENLTAWNITAGYGFNYAADYGNSL